VIGGNVCVGVAVVFGCVLVLVSVSAFVGMFVLGSVLVFTSVLLLVDDCVGVD
jgi:hypothetical protein